MNAPNAGPKSKAFYNYWVIRGRTSTTSLSSHPLSKPGSEARTDHHEFESARSAPSAPSDASPRASPASLSGRSFSTNPSTANAEDLGALRAATSDELGTLRVSCMIFLKGSKPLPGRLTIDSERIQFEPDPRFKLVAEKGIGHFQVYIDARDLLEAGAVTLPVEERKGADRALVTTLNCFLQLHIRAGRIAGGAGAGVDKARGDGGRDAFGVRSASSDALGGSTPSAGRGAREKRRSLSPPESPVNGVAAPSSARALGADVRMLLFKLGAKDVLYEVTRKAVDVIAATKGARRSQYGTLTSVPIESPDIEDVVSLTTMPLDDQYQGDLRRQSTLMSSLSPTHMALGVLTRDGEPQDMLLPPEIADQLVALLPLSVRFCKWYLGYSPSVHGVSLLTFYRQVANQGPSLLVIRDAAGRIFGGFASESWISSSKYYGTGESFVFAIDTDETSGDHELHAHPWSAKNEFLMFSDDHMIAMGGGGSSAIVVEGSFLRGTSQKCSTFESPVLSASEDFVVSALELWCFEE